MDVAVATARRARDPAVLGAVLVFLSAAAFGSMVVFGRWAFEDGVSPISLLFLRFAIAAPVLALLARSRKAARPRGRAALIAVVMGAAYVGNSLSYFVALGRIPAATVVALFFTYPVFVMVAARFFDAERIGVAGLVALALAVAGAVLSVGGTGLQLDSGVLLPLLAGGFYTGYVVLARRTASVHPFASGALITGVAAIVFGVLALRQGLQLPHSFKGWFAILALALLSSVFAMAAFLAGAARLGATRSAIVSAAEPVVAALLAAMVLGEPVRAGAVLGLVLITVSTVLVISSRARSAQAKE